MHGDEVRLIADAHLGDLEIVREAERQMRKREEETRMKESLDLLRQDYKLLHDKHEYRATNQYNNQQQYFHMPGRVLHLDGDSAYLKSVWRSTKRSGFLYTAFIAMKEMSSVIEELIDEYRPDLLVITGHDAYSKQKGDINNLDAYRHSKIYRNRSKARRKFPILISSSFCRRMPVPFESLIRAGANFASSPSRVNIHALDPVYIVAKSASLRLWTALTSGKCSEIP
ncbi:sporulation peptidase YabG [Bacillus licheniformis]|nr:sporulation peptidase YabG [Bacillus licheniformis]